MNNNPFEYMQNFMSPETFSKNMKNMMNTDYSAMSEIAKNVSDALSSTGKTAAESMQSILKKGGESMQKNNTEMYDTMKDAISAGDFNQMNECQQKYIHNAVDNNIKNTKEVLDISGKAMVQMLDTINNSVKESLNKSTPKGKK